MRGELEKIVACDKEAQRQLDLLMQKKLNLESEVSAEKEEIKRNLMKRAEEEADAEIARVRAVGEKQWAADRIKYKHLGEQMEKMYVLNRDSWAFNIADRVIGGEE